MQGDGGDRGGLLVTKIKLSIIERVSSGQRFIIHYVGYIWDSVSVYYRGMRVSSKRGSTVDR